MRTKLLFIILVFFLSCSSEEVITQNENDEEIEMLYFPPIGSDIWETTTPETLGWNTSNIQQLLDFVEEKDTKGFIILKNGKIAIEWYGNGANANTNRQWNSAGKTLSAFTIGIAQQEGLLNINDPSRDYLGNNWSSLSNAQEQNITIKHHLSMTTGLDYTVPNNTCYDPDCLDYLNDSSDFWYYHNAPYTLTKNIIEGAANTDFSSYFNTKLRDKIGMQGAWVSFGYFNIYYSNARSMARFGLLNLNKGVWSDTTILSDLDYFNAMTSTSQNLNKAYGYLWWLNGKSSFRAPLFTIEFSGKLIDNAPDDLYAGLGKDDQKLYIVPSQNLVIVRMGDNTGESLLGPSSFDNALWEKINLVIN